jgi:hypothetical protein
VIPTYTGHYHKPHTVPGTRITYVGSPYQVSRAEAGQRKALVVLDAEAGWSAWCTGDGGGALAYDGGGKSGAGTAGAAASGGEAVHGGASALALPPASLLPLDLAGLYTLNAVNP